MHFQTFRFWIQATQREKKLGFYKIKNKTTEFYKNVTPWVFIKKKKTKIGHSTSVESVVGSAPHDVLEGQMRAVCSHLDDSAHDVSSVGVGSGTRLGLVANVRETFGVP